MKKEVFCAYCRKPISAAPTFSGTHHVLNTKEGMRLTTSTGIGLVEGAQQQWCDATCAVNSMELELRCLAIAFLLEKAENDLLAGENALLKKPRKEGRYEKKSRTNRI